VSEHKVVWSLLAVASLATALITWRYAPRSEVAPGSLDPAVEHYTADNSSHFGAIERWAFRGMAGAAFRRHIEGAGYACTEPAARQLVCTRNARWPLARALQVHASFDPLGRLLEARTESRLASDNALARRAASFARQAGWIEPETASVSGFELETIDLITRMVADALRGANWLATCDKAANLVACAEQARGRKAQGFVPLAPGPVSVGTAADIIRSLETMRLQPLRPRGADKHGQDALLVRVADGQQWLDYVGGDLGGREFGVSIALALEGGAPTKAVVRFGVERRELPLAGGRKTANGDAPLFLVPPAGDGEYRFADFHGHPVIDREGTVRRLRTAVPQADPAFRAPLVRHLLSAIAAPSGPEESLGLAPALSLVEERAEILRAAGARDWLAPEDRWRFVPEWFGGQPVLRAAWAHAVCDPDPDEPGQDRGCWDPVLSSDTELSELLRAEVTRHEAATAPLSAGHPIRIRLQRWRRLWEPT
jgi:hypothetical protein